MNLNFIQLLTVLEIITIQRSSDGNNIKPHAAKSLVIYNYVVGFLYSTLRKFRS